jgi:hypothetical protein
MNENLSPEGEAIVAYGAATMAAFKVLVACLQSGAHSNMDSFRKHYGYSPTGPAGQSFLD